MLARLELVAILLVEGGRDACRIPMSGRAPACNEHYFVECPMLAIGSGRGLAELCILDHFICAQLQAVQLAAA
jgi:hypothetical protein